MTPAEEQLLAVIRSHPKGANEETLTTELDWEKAEIVNLVNSLSEQGFVDFVTVGKQLFFKARDINEANKTRDLSQNEKIVYNFIKSEKSKGIWSKDIKSKSGLHIQVVTDCIKTLEKYRLIKSVKSVKNPTRKLYMLFDLTPSEEITGGAWYTDQELDVAFIEGLTDMVFKFIGNRSYPKPTSSYASNGDETDAAQLIYPPDHTGYATTKDVHAFLKKSGVLKVDLGIMDVQMLVDRLWYDGKVTRIRKLGGDEVIEVWMYRTVRGQSVGAISGGGGGVWWTDTPCGKCAVAQFCKSGGPVSPEGCVYFSKWLEF
ncbi:RNA polymerase Rpc34 [Rhizoclosmatium globosum]|uniref:DNA-directed RNA polymerase III subunit RPC6 n=1 Tax=Rhizoclosmatium globosum TaxID=329046 RepID=A0A1Y2C0G5_9FUNG|nr:RNA polymerase Rpc34 [Rhizoclosmatium globosum]|eukprot:ORY40367.1 RNA polymerase Rpc34 [Rhizoclosmatium globosum]